MKSLIVATIAAAALTGAAMMGFTSASRVASSSGSLVPERERASEPKDDRQPSQPRDYRVTRAEIDALDYGMSLEQVRETFRRPATRSYSVSSPDAEQPNAMSLTVWHVWQNADGSRVGLGFANDALVQKTYMDETRQDGA